MVPSVRESCPIQLTAPLRRSGPHLWLATMSDEGRLSGPGGLSGPGSLSGPGGVALAPEPAPARQGLLPDEPLRELAARYGLKPAAVRPPILAYIRELWQRRHFVVGFATARTVAMYTEARLGQLWQILTPLL